MGGVVSAGVDNDELIDKLKEEDYIKREFVERAFRLVDRGYYLTPDCEDVAYRDNAWKSGNLHLSAPCIYAQVMEGLDLGPGMSFLNIGSGTGYLSTMVGLIIGPFGINHGIELHSSVIAYARERLSWFLANAGAIDVSSFCEPQFVQGNALCFGGDMPQYDRIYCGASCPSSHEEYMKNLIKVNGILVMPRSDKLVKITRTDEVTWISEALIPVSFASLVMPDQTFAGTETASAPPVRIPTLQEISRERIRCTCRAIIEDQNVDFLKSFTHKVPVSTPRVPRQGCRQSRTFPHVTISDSEYETEASEGNAEGASIVYTTRRLHANQLAAFLELAQTLAMSRRHNNAEAEPEEVNANDELSDIATSEEMVVEGDEREPDFPIEEEDEDEAVINEVLGLEPSAEPVNVQVNVEASDDVQPGTFNGSAGNENPHSSSNNAKMSSTIAEDSDLSDQGESWSPYGHLDEVMSGTEEEPSRPFSKDPKKNEKFDSGIVEDVESRMSTDDQSSSSLHSDSENYLESPAEGDRFQPSSLPNQRSRKASRKSRKSATARKNRERSEDSKRKRTIKYDRGSRIDSKIVIDKYTALMAERIRKLPLPPLLQLYVNFSRPL